MNDVMDQDGVALHFVEGQIVVDDEHSIAKRREFGDCGEHDRRSGGTGQAMTLMIAPCLVSRFIGGSFLLRRGAFHRESRSYKISITSATVEGTRYNR